MAVPHTHSNVELNFLLNGRMACWHGGVRHTVEAGHGAMFWAGIPHHTLPPGVTGDGIWIALPLAWMIQWKLPRELEAQLLAGRFVIFEFVREAPMRWLQDFNSNDGERIQTMQLEIRTTLARMALSLPATTDPTQASKLGGSGGDLHIVRTTAFLAAHHAEPLTIPQIAEAVKLNPTYLMGLFRRHCHISLWEYVTRLRVSYAQRLLATTEMSVLEVAMESGFGSIAPFYQAFSRYVGARPLAFRRAQRASAASV
jgi:AraC-like DNA-binding protein